MKQEIYASLFIRFLKRHGIYHDYMELWSKDSKSQYLHIRRWLAQSHPSRFIFNAFTWPSSSWAYFHRQWMEFLRKTNNRIFL